MSEEYYEIPGGLAWCKANLKIIIGNRDLAEIMQFGDLWRDRGHRPLVHVVSPAMDNGKMWEEHVDPSGLLDNIPAHIDLFIVDFFNRGTPEIPKTWDQMISPPKWLLWEYEAGKVKFNGTYQQCLDLFGFDPASSVQENGGSTPEQPSLPGSGSEGASAYLHLKCPHCKKVIF